MSAPPGEYFFHKYLFQVCVKWIHKREIANVNPDIHMCPDIFDYKGSSFKIRTYNVDLHRSGLRKKF